MHKSFGLALVSMFASLSVACTQETAERVVEKPVEVVHYVPVPSLTPAPPPANAGEAAQPAPATGAGTEPAENVPACDKTLAVDVWRDDSHVVHPGDKDVVLLRVKVTAPSCSDALFGGVELNMFATQLSPQFNAPLCAKTPCLTEDDFIFHDWKLRTAGDLVVHNGGADAWHGWNVPQVVDIRAWFDVLPKGESRYIEITADLAENYVMLAEGLRYRAYVRSVYTDMPSKITDHTLPFDSTADTVIVNSR